MTELTVKIRGFEGPLDLLLHLIQQYEMDIYDVPLADITDQYLDYLNTMKTLQLEVAGEYLVMAATLLAIKSRHLLPVYQDDEIEIAEEDETEVDLKEQLFLQLIEYRKIKYAAKVLKEKEKTRQRYYDKEPESLKEYETILPFEKNQMTTIDLFFAFHRILEKNQKGAIPVAKVEKEERSIEECVKQLKQQFQIKKTIFFSQLFEKEKKDEMIVTFLAILELIKLDFLCGKQKTHEDILLWKKEKRK